MSTGKEITFNGNLGSYKVISTDDGDLTIWSEKFDENCHSLAGSYKETEYNYLEGCKIQEKIESGPECTIFEVGLGAGIGILATLELYKKLKTKTKINFITTELDESLVLWVIKNQLPKEFNLKKVGEHYFGKIENFGLCILIGDALETINTLPQGSVDAIFQDPFSPKKNPTLWTIDWFEKLKLIAKKNALISTYSASTSIRKSMVMAGWTIENRKGFAYKKSSTVGAIESEYCDLEFTRSILENQKIKPFL